MEDAMKVMKPELVWIKRRCYRTNALAGDSSLANGYQEHDRYNDDEIMTEMYDEGDDDDFVVEKIDDNRYCTKFHVPKHYIGSVIGRKGASKNRIEAVTKTEIKFPRPQDKNSDVAIFGSSEQSVKTARRRINVIVVSSRLKQRPTHFISLPVNSPEIMENYEKFKKSVLSECAGSRGLEESIFVKPKKLHITVGVLCLMDNEEREAASKIFTEAIEKVIEPTLKNCPSLKVRVKGLDYMNDDPSEINVLYGKVEEFESPKGILQELADALVEHFYNKGFMDKETDHVKIHVTLLNTRHRARSPPDEGEPAPKYQKRTTFDGTKIIEKFSDYDFGVMEVEEFHLSQMHTDVGEEYYQSTCVLTRKSS